MSTRRNDEFDRDLPLSSSLRLYPVFYDTGDKQNFINLFRAYVIETGVQSDFYVFTKYTVEEEDFLDSISFKFYNTPNLWWLVAAANDFTNPYEDLESGAIIRVLKYEYINKVFDDMMKIGNL